MGLRFYTFKNEYDLNQLKDEGAITTRKNLCENFLFEVISSYTGEEGIVWFWASYDDLDMESYLDYKYKIEFREPKDYILLTPERFDYMTLGVLEKYDSEMPDLPTPLEGYKWLIENTDFKKYIEDFRPNPNEQNAFNPGSKKRPVSNVYMGVMTKLKSSDIIKITDYELRKDITNDVLNRDMNVF